MENLKWSNSDFIPKIGDRVKINVNGIGYGVVDGYFCQEGWLGVWVDLEKPFRGEERITAFGAEIKKDER